MRIVSRLTWGLLVMLTFQASELSAQQDSRWTLSSEIREIGDGADELFESVRFGRILADGRVLVGDAGLLIVRIYDSSGNRQVEIGGEGAGPGEFGSLDGLWIPSDGRIGAWDATNRRVTMFDSEGRLISTHLVGADGRPAGNIEVFFGAFENDDILLGALQFGDPHADGSAVPGRWTLARFSPDGELRGVVGEIPGLWRAGRAPIPFSPVPQVAVRGDSVWIVDPYEAEMVVRDGHGVAVRTIELPMMEVTADDARRARDALERELRSREASFYLGLLDQIPETNRIPSVADLLLDEETGNVWVKPYDPFADSIWLKKNAMQTGAGGNWLVIGSSGTPIASIQIPQDMTLLDVRGGRLLAISRNALDVERVVLLEVES